MSTVYTQEASCTHCHKTLGTHNILVRVDLNQATGIHIGTDCIHFGPGLFDEICARNHGSRHEVNTVTSIPQSFLDTVLPD